MKNLVLFSSANESGNTATLLAQVMVDNNCEIVNLDKLVILPYNYQNQYPADDFYPLVDKMLAAKTLVFASPVYWSAPTAQMKNFVDRLTELLDVGELKAKARAFENKPALVLTTSASERVSPVFYGFFNELFRYFKMNFKACLHANSSDSLKTNQHELSFFTAQL
jgi:multimeric flavodoxin WrbA